MKILNFFKRFFKKPAAPRQSKKTLRFRRYLDIAGYVRLVTIDASNRSDFVKWLGDWEEMDIY